MDNNNMLELLIQKRDEFNARARYNYHQRTLNGTNIKIISKDNQKKRGRKPIDKQVVVKAPVGRPRKDLDEVAIENKHYTYLLPKGPRGRRPKVIEVFDNTINNNNE